MMVALSFLVVVAVASSDDAPFDAALAAEGARGLAAARTAREGSGPRSLDATATTTRNESATIVGAVVGGAALERQVTSRARAWTLMSAKAVCLNPPQWPPRRQIR